MLWVNGSGDRLSLFQFSLSVVSDVLQPHRLPHARLPCPSPSPGVHLNPCPMSRWCHPIISSSVSPFSSCLQSFPALGFFQMSQFFISGEVQFLLYWSFSFSISPSNEYSGLISFRIDWFNFLAVRGTLKSLLQHHRSKASILWHSAFSHPYMTTGKILALTRWMFAGKVMFLLFNMLSSFVTAFFPRSKHLLISWLGWNPGSPTYCMSLRKSINFLKTSVSSSVK